MILDELRTLPEALVAHLDPLRVQQYVRAAGWVPNPRVHGKAALYERPEAPRREQILLPLSRDLADFTPRMAEAVAYLAQWEKRPALELLRALLPAADVVPGGATGAAAAAGDVPLEHGLSLLPGGAGRQGAVTASKERPVRFRNPWIDPRIVQTRPEDAEAYLTRHGWKRIGSADNPDLLRYEIEGNEHAPAVFVPIRVGSGPALQWMIDLVADLAQFEDRWAVDVLHDILRQPAATTANGPALPTSAETAPR